MSENHVDQFPAQIFSSNPNILQLAVLALVLIDFLVIQFIVRRKSLHIFFLGFHSKPESDGIKDRAETKGRNSDPSGIKRVDQTVSKEDVEIVLRSLGMSCNSEDGILDEADVFLVLEENPRLDEVRAAFDVFDDNKDGFIDAEELQIVMTNLGLEEGFEIDGCRRMIGVFDEDGDGRIDFHEFVRLLESSSI